MKAARVAFTQTLLEMAKDNENIFALASDSRGSVTLTDFANTLPNQFVECGIAEQNAVGMAAGIALAGKRPFVCGPASFYAARSVEQIKVDVAYSQMNVKIIGVSGGISYGALGGTHHSLQDIAMMRAIANLEVYIPSDANQTAALTRYLGRSDVPAYVRMGRGAVPDIYPTEIPFIPGKANILKQGTKAAIITCGEMTYYALEAAKILGDITVIDMPSIKPLDIKAVLNAAETGRVITLEEHSIYGGLGGAVAEVLCQHKPTPLTILGLPDENLYNGSSSDVFAHYGLDAPGLVKRIQGLIGG